MLEGKTVLLGVTGSIAAYKACTIVRQLKRLGAEVWVTMTREATYLVGPQTFHSLSGNPVITDLFADVAADKPIPHTALSKTLNLILIAPATANVIGKLAEGIADDALTTFPLDFQGPVVIAPAMHDAMWQNETVQQNSRKLKEKGYVFINPESGPLASGDSGEGRLADPETIIEKVIDALHVKQDLKGKKVLVTAGGTREAIDPVRFIGNPSTGKMGYALARAAADRGARVTLVSGPTLLSPPAAVKLIRAETAEDMYRQCITLFPEQDITIMAAAVADYRPKKAASQKIKKGPATLTLILEKTPDILAALGKRKGHRILVGFSMETENLVKNALRKLKEKKLNLIVANDVTQAGAGFAVDTNVVKVIYPDGKVEDLPRMTKLEVAHRILDSLSTHYL